MLTFLFLINLAFSSLPNENFSCRLVTVSANCQVQECVGELKPYPQTMAIVLPIDPQGKVRLHLHGFSEAMQGDLPLGPFNQKYDWNHLGYPTIALARSAHEQQKKDGPAKLLKAYGMHSRACDRGETLVVPLSRGKCTTYKEYFKTPEALPSLLSSLKGHFMIKELTLSGHSGAGGVIRRILELDPKALDQFQEIILYDGLYHPDDAKILISWASRLPKKKVVSYTIPVGSPRRWADEILKNDRTLLNGSVIQNKKPLVEEGLDHWSIVKKYWLD